MPIFYLSDHSFVFPDPSLASDRGILAVGGDLSTGRLLEAYRMGIFPWYNEDDPILWWTPDPRCVLFPKELKISKSMRPYLNQPKFSLTVDQAFDQVIRACGSSRRGPHGQGTWITPAIIRSYNQLHEMGYAHSVEVWEGEDLVGGLYGIQLGKCFFGESMFSLTPNASKFGFIRMVRGLERKGFELIDCQQETRHLKSLGATVIPREKFQQILKRNESYTTDTQKWRIEDFQTS